jgi:hypothetical protein
MLIQPFNIVERLVRGQNPEGILVTVCQSLRGDGSLTDSVDETFTSRFVVRLKDVMYVAYNVLQVAHQYWSKDFVYIRRG